MALFGEIRHDLTRLREIARVMARHGFGPTLRRIPLVTRMVSDDELKKSSKPAPERFCALLEELGPTFVKLGQILSTRTDLLPIEFTDELSRLQDRVPPFPFEEVRKQIRAEFGQPIESLFASFDEHPLASASMAQVHAARLHEGEKVVVKVLRPGIHEQVRADASILVLLAQLLELTVEEASAHDAKGLAAEFEAGLKGELDFHAEKTHLKAFAANNADREAVHVPQIYEEFCGASILTMERIYGVRITELAEINPERGRDMAEILVKANLEHVFSDGMFHADPHPGNVLVTDDDQLVFLDFGLMGFLSRETQDRLLSIILAVSLQDADTLARLLVRIGNARGRVHLGELSAAITGLFDRYLGRAIGDINPTLALRDLLALSTNFGIHMPREFALLSKNSVTIDGLLRHLHPDYDPSPYLKERARTLLMERFDPRKMSGGGLRTALQVSVLLQEVPLQLSQVLLDLERGTLQVSMQSSDLESLDRNLRGLAMTVFGGFLASSCLLGGFYVLARYEWTFYGIPVLPAVAFAFAGGCFGVAFTWYLTGGKFRKLSLGRFFGTRKK